MKCSELGWLCIPLVVESYGAWGKEAMESFSSLASRLAITSSRPKSAVLSELYGRLNLNLVRAIVRAMILPSRLSLKCYLVLVMFSCVLYVLLPVILMSYNNDKIIIIIIIIIKFIVLTIKGD